jgi:hypothetical protein
MAGIGIHNKEIAKSFERLPARGLARWRRINALMQKIARALVFKLSVDGGDISEIEGGLHLKITGGDADTGHPWKVRAGSSSNSKIVTPGVFGGHIVPTINGIRMDEEPPPEISVNAGADTYIYLVAQFDKEFEDSFVSNLIIGQGAVQIVSSTSELASNPTIAELVVLLATCHPSGTVTQLRTNNMEWSFTDTGTDSGQVAFSVFSA